MSILNYRLPVAITSFNRPDYLKQCIDSLEIQNDMDDLEFILVQDGVVNRFSGEPCTEQALVDECIRIFEASSLPNKTVMTSNHNL